MDRGRFMKHLSLKIKIAETVAEKEAALKMREAVFVDEQEVPIELELDEHDATAIHFICTYNDAVVGASRLRIVDDYAKLERVCISKNYRGLHFGKQIIAMMESEISKLGIHQAKLNAQVYVADFYKKMGYEITAAEPFMDAGIEHVAMVKQL